MHLEAKYLPNWVKEEFINNNCKPMDIEVEIGSNNLTLIDQEMQRLLNEINHGNMLQWAVDRNKQLIKYLDMAKRNFVDPAIVHFSGHEYQNVIINNTDGSRFVRASGNDTWLNDSAHERLFASSFMYVLKSGEMLLQHYTFCSKHFWRLYVHPNDFNALQLKDAQKLSIEERIVLCATRSFKGSYAGDKNARFTEANRLTKIRFDTYKNTEKVLLDKGLLKKAGSGLGLSTEGKNLADKLNLYTLAQEFAQ